MPLRPSRCSAWRDQTNSLSVVDSYHMNRAAIGRAAQLPQEAQTCLVFDNVSKPNLALISHLPAVRGTHVARGGSG